MNNSNTLSVKNIKKYYYTFALKTKKQTKIALNSVSFTMQPGFYGLLGPNGAGKSTMVNIIAGNLAPSGGKVLWNNRNIKMLGKSFRCILGYMPQQQNLYDGFTGRHFLLYLATLKEIPKRLAVAEMERVADLVHLTNELNKRLSAYSGGMKQRLLAAAAMLGTPKLLIMDEPTAGLDPKERVHLRNTLSNVARDSIVIVCTHVVSDVESVADEILLLKDGRLIDKDSPKALIEKYNPGKCLEDVYLAIFGGDES